MKTNKDMYYNTIHIPALIETGEGILQDLDTLLESSHLYFPEKILITQENLYEIFKDKLSGNDFADIIFCKGGELAEANEIISRIHDSEAVLMAFGGGSVLDLVKYVATRINNPYLTIPSTLSNDAIYSSVSRLTVNLKKRSFTVQPPLGVILDLSVIRMSPRELILAGAGDLITNLSAVKDWALAHENNGEVVNELACILSKQAAMSIWDYSEEKLFDDDFLLDLFHGLVTSGLSMTIAGNSRSCSGSEHLISHAIDEYFPEKSTMHGIQVAWAFLEIERQVRKDSEYAARLQEFYDRTGLSGVISQLIPWKSEDLPELITYAKRIRKRYTVLNTV